jgi:hypothetical protein
MEVSGMNVVPKITADRAAAFVQEYWQLLLKKRPGLEKVYTYDAKIFNPFEQRPESGRVSVARKEREYYENKTTFQAEITSPIDIFLLADNVALATYSFRWHATGMMAAGKRFDKSLRNGRASDVITLDAEGQLRFVHQHHSDIWRDTAPPSS